MSSAYLIMWLISLGSLFVFLLLFFSTTTYLIGHARRQKVEYKNFLYKSKYFNVQLHPVMQGAFYVTLFALGVLILFTGLTYNAELRVYTLPFTILFVIVVTLYLVYTILSQIDIDITQYRNNFIKVKGALEKKNEAEKSIAKTLEYKNNVTVLINDFERQIRLVEDPEKFKLKETIKIIDQFVTSQTDTINGYEEEILNRFNKGLQTYFELRIPKALVLPKVSLDFEVDYNSVRSEVFDKYHKIFNDTLYELIESEKYNTSKIITKGLQILKDNEYSPTQELVELILISIDNIEGSPRELIDYLLNKKIVELEVLISYAINKKILWVFKNNIFETQDQLSTISERLITEDAYFQSIAFISNYFTRLKTVLAFTEKIKNENKTLKLFNNYKKVMNVDATFYNESKVLENKLMSVKEFFKGRKVTDQLRKSLQNVSDPKKTYANRKEIEHLYQTVLGKFEALKLNTTQSLLLYSGLEDHILDLRKTSKLFTDYYNRLLMKDLVIASILLYAIFIYHNEDSELYDETITALKTNEYKNTLNGINLDVPFEEHKELSKRIIKNTLLTDSKGRVANIIVNLEKERLTLKKLAEIG